MVQFLNVPVSGNEINFENWIIPAMNFLLSKFFELPFLGIFNPLPYMPI